jgi:curved DNA-binding protein CbpA
MPTQKSLLDQSYALLGVRPGATYAEVKLAFRKMALQTHPDVSALPPHLAEERFKALSEAYAYIKQANRWM